MSRRAGRTQVVRGASLSFMAFMGPACSSSKEPNEPAELAALELSDGRLIPAYSLENTQYRVDLGLLAHTLELRVEASTRAPP